MFTAASAQVSINQRREPIQVISSMQPPIRSIPKTNEAETSRRSINTSCRKAATGSERGSCSVQQKETAQQKEDTGNFLIFIRSVGMKDVMTLTVHGSDTVERIKKRFHGLALPKCQQILLFEGKELEGNMTLEHYGISNLATLDQHFLIKNPTLTRRVKRVTWYVSSCLGLKSRASN